MNPKDPHTWNDLSTHPTYNGHFDPKWYDGDWVEDLAMLKRVALAVLDTFPSYSCELIVLDDSTMYCTVSDVRAVFAEVYPALDDVGQRCYFVDLVSQRGETRVKSVDEVLSILKQ